MPQRQTEVPVSVPALHATAPSAPSHMFAHAVGTRNPAGPAPHSIGPPPGLSAVALSAME
jgi:hypothetical protein